MIQEGYVRPPHVQPRNAAGWITLLVFFALAITSAISGSVSETGPTNKAHGHQQQLLQDVMTHKWFQTHTKRQPIEPWNEQTDPQFKKLDSEIVALRGQTKNDLMAARLYAVMSFERKRPIDFRNLSGLLTNTRVSDQSFYDIYKADTLSERLANHLISELPDSPAVYKVAKVHALEKAGVKDPLKPYFAVSNPASLTWLLALVTVGGLMVWANFGTQILNKAVIIKGLPMDGLSPGWADRLALHAALILALFEILGETSTFIRIPPEMISRETMVSVKTLAIGILMVLGIIGLQYLPINGVRLRLSTLGVTKEDLWPNIKLGFLGFLAEMPVAMALAAVGTFIFSRLPTPTHPVSTLLQSNHSFAVVAPQMIFGSLIVPFWEELTFRGLIFPALKRFTGIVYAAIISSFLFASVHPQGPALWLSLAWIGSASCFLSYKSKSMVPSMVMHCLHNTLIFAMTLVMS